MALAKARSARVILNLAPALPVEEATLRQVDVLVLNEHEASQLCTHMGQASDSTAKLAGPISRLLGTTVIITRAPGGAVGAKGDQLWQVPSMPVQAVDTTGAGDCFVGVLAAAMDRGLEMQPAIQRACVAASMARTLVGAAPSFPPGAEIDLIWRASMAKRNILIDCDPGRDDASALLFAARLDEECAPVEHGFVLEFHVCRWTGGRPTIA